MKNILTFIFFLLLSPIKTILSLVLFPFAYLLRNVIRTNDIWKDGYLFKPRKLLFPLWIILNDSEYFTYKPYWFPTKEGYYPKFIFAFWQKTENMKQGYLHFDNIFEALKFGYKIEFTLWFKLKLYMANFLMDYWFNGIRNSFVNLNNYLKFKVVGDYVGVIKHWGSNRNWIELRQFTKSKRLAVQFYIFGKRNFIGWGRSGRFWFEVFKK